MERFAPACLQLIDSYHITHDKAVQHLLDLWHAQNTLDILDWDNMHPWAPNPPLQPFIAQPEIPPQPPLHIENEVRQNEGDKHCPFFLPFADVPPPSTIPITPSLLTLCKGEYIQLYFFINKGLADAQSTSHSANDNVFILLPDEQGLHSFIPIAAARAKKSIIEDQDLNWTQIDEATHCMLQAIKEANWPLAHIEAMLHFWLNLGTHE